MFERFHGIYFVIDAYLVFGLHPEDLAHPTCSDSTM